MSLGLSKNVVALMMDPLNYTTFGGDDTHPMAVFKIPSNIG